jgi:signal transduction histidine kinase
MVDILDELLDLARIEAGGSQDIHLTRINLREVVQGLVNSFQLPQGRVAPQVVLPDLYCSADLRKVNQIVLNILSNAYKYSAGQGGLVSITLAGPELTENDHLAGIVIQDHGMGMAPQHVALIFERFYRVDKSCAIPGTGLGMSIVKELMDLLKGKILITSALGQGTTVTLLFPTVH